MSREGIVVIQPRHGITAHEIRHFLQVQFQQPGQSDGNPLINADISCTPAEAS